MCTQPQESLDAVTSTGPGTAVDLGQNYAHHTMILSASGSGTAQVLLEISHDGTTWASVNSGNVTAGVGFFPVTVQVERVARYVRANIASFSSGTPTVTATIASA